MQRYFTSIKNNNKLLLNKDDTYHIKKVMRMNINDKIEVVYNKSVFIAKIVSISDEVEVEIIEQLDENNELSNYVTLVQSLVKEQKMDIILQKSTELGVSEIIPYKAYRSIIKESEKDLKKIDRWNKITKEASEQSKRSVIPIVRNSINIDELIHLGNDYDVKIFCSVNEKKVFLNKIINNINNRRILIVVGPEGGFDEHEENKLVESGFISTSLGNSVLRTETAGLFVLSCIRYCEMG